MLTGVKNFILKGKVVDLAVAVVIGAVVTAFVQSVFMPFIAGLVGAPNLDSLQSLP